MKEAFARFYWFSITTITNSWCLFIEMFYYTAIYSPANKIARRCYVQ